MARKSRWNHAMRCIFPRLIKIKKKTGETFVQKVPCGKCYYCLQRYRSQWLSRLQVEARYSKSVHFVTLTYEDCNLPLDDNGIPCVDKSHIQKFMKRLRKNTGGKFRYFCVSEYGPHTLRPHYHLLMFNLGYIEHEKKDKDGNVIPDQSYVDVLSYDTVHGNILSSWKLGNVSVYPLSLRRICYTTKYHSVPKNFGIPKQMKPTFTLMSRNPGIGYQYKEIGKSYHSHNVDRWFFPTGDGGKRSMPRFYYEAFYNEDDKRLRAENLRLENEDKLSGLSLKEQRELRKKELSDYENFKFITKKRFRDRHQI